MARLQAELEKSQKEMTQLVTEIDELEENIKLRTEKLAQQARTIQVDGDTANYIEFILEADSLVDVVGRMDVVSTIVRANKTLIQEQQADKKLVVEKKDATAEVIEQQEKSVAALETTAAELEQQKLEKEVLVAQLASERATVESDREHFLAQKAAAESLVSDYVSAKEETERATREALQQRNRENTQEVSETESSATESVVINTGTENREPSTNKTSPEKRKKQKKEEPKKEIKKETKQEDPAPSGGTSWSSLSSIANSLLGIPYKYGGTTTSGFDCSGFTSYVFQRAGKSLPRTAASQYAGSTKVSNPRPGDLVFFSGNGRSVTHVGIYVGGGKFIGSQTSTGVAYTEVRGSYWGPKLVGYGRY